MMSFFEQQIRTFLHEHKDSTTQFHHKLYSTLIIKICSNILSKIYLESQDLDSNLFKLQLVKRYFTKTQNEQKLSQTVAGLTPPKLSKDQNIICALLK